ncbi:hypothetical protein EYZ11_007449 [Aspergillus tanneri]|uniref:Transcription factor domain-containing protein n=1 Tax=Aspergillus tanneri TaxID=1220188 RepID=A0A4S3JD01_9EURO|nr:hypothetical protein EYZ11_007449 [Aspergillus tanneri]
MYAVLWMEPPHVVDAATPTPPAAAAHEVVTVPPSAQNTAFYHHLSTPDQDAQSILSRLDRIEAVLGINKERPTTASVIGSDPDDEVVEAPLPELWAAAKNLRSITRPPQNEGIWSRSSIRRLWASFLDNLPLLHFLKDQNAFSSPSPLLLASVLYISALHSPSPELTSMAGGYFVAICSAIAELVIPNPLPNLLSLSNTNPRDHESGTAEESRVFQNILGLIMASLCSEAFVETTDKWIAIAYRLLLDHCPTAADSTTQDWPGLFSGIQVIDIEHASMHMCHPLLPRQPPTSALQQLNGHEGDAYRGLTQIMHHGLSHFVRRGLPTIWSFVSAREPDTLSSVRAPFTDEDSQVIRLWAKKLDDWLNRLHQTDKELSFFYNITSTNYTSYQYIILHEDLIFLLQTLLLRKDMSCWCQLVPCYDFVRTTPAYGPTGIL